MRKIFLIKDTLQFRYLALLLISIILPALFIGSCLYYLIFTLLAEDLGIPEVIAEHLLPLIHKIDGILIVGLPIIIIFLAVWGFVLSSRLAGPIARVEKEIYQITKNEDYSRRIKVRKKDDLHGIAEGINKLLDKIERKEG